MSLLPKKEFELLMKEETEVYISLRCMAFHCIPTLHPCIHNELAEEDSPRGGGG
jgi:hypothetical protein